MLDLGQQGIAQLIAAQRAALGNQKIKSLTAKDAKDAKERQ